MSTIDSLQIEIQSDSTNASAGISALAKSLEKLNGSASGGAVQNIKALSSALKELASISDKAKKVDELASSGEKLAKTGTFAKTISQLKKLSKAVGELNAMNTGGVSEKFAEIAHAASHLSNVKASGFSSLMTGLSKVKKVTDDLDPKTIADFSAKVKELSEKLEPLSSKMTSVAAGFKAISSNAKSAASGVGGLGGKVNVTTLNLSTMITTIRGVIDVLRPLINLLVTSIGDAMEWDGISQRFGRGFGNQAEEVYNWVKRLNQEIDINIQQFMQYSSTYATMLTGFGLAVKDASNMAVGYMELTYDIWAGYNDIYKSLDDAAIAIRSAIAGEVEPIRKAGFTITEATLQQTAANHGLAISLETASEAQKSYLRYLTLVDQAHAQNLVGTYAKELNTAEGQMRTFRQQLKSLAQTFGSLFLPILTKVMPWLQAFVDLLGEAIIAVANFFGIEIQKVDFGGFSDGGLGDLADSADGATGSLGNTAGAIEDTTDAIKELKNATIGIDELNVISPPSNTGNSGAGSDPTGGWGDGSGSSGILGNIESLWDESIFDSIQFEVDKIKGQLEEALSQITAVISGFMLAIGTILVVSGANIPLGLGLMAVGAVGLVATIVSNWNGMSEQLAKTLTTVTAVLGGFLLAIGAFLAFSGVNVGLGAALMVAGAVSLGTAVAINWKFLHGDMKNTLSILTGIVGGALLALGALFAFTGADVPLGIALMAAGAVSLATTIGLNWNAMSEPMRKAIGTLEAIVGSALISFGAILALTGANIPLGVGMIAAGAVSLASAVVLNWGSLTGSLTNTIATITALVSGALLGVGAILAFTGVSLPIGIAMIAAGAVGIMAAAPINWKSLTQGVISVLREIGIAVGGSLLALGAVLAFTGVALPLGIALMAVGAVGLVSGVALNWEGIVTSVKNALDKIGIVAGVSLLALGLILCLSGVGIPLGIVMMAAGGASLVGGIAVNWDGLLAKMRTAWGKIEGWWNGIKALKPVEIAVGLIKKGWSTVKGWIGSIPGVSQAVSLVKSGWSTIKKWVGNIPSLSQSIKLAKSGWSSIKNWIGSISAVSQGVKLAKSGWSSVKNWIGSMPSLSASIKLVKSGWSTVKSWLGSLDFKLNFKLPKIKVSWGEKTVAGFTIKYPNGFSTYAKGGFPDVGEMFIAREAGPEMVGRIGSRNVVANNEQIVDGISRGVYEAVMAAMKANGGNNGEQSVRVYLDSREITSSVERRQHERGVSIMGSQVHAY